MNEPTQRERYQPSGRIGGLFLPLSGLALVASAALGGFLYFAYVHGFYIVVFVPLLAAALAAGAVYLAVKLGHCRNRWAGGFIGLVAGLIVYLGYYHAGLVDMIGVNNAHHVEILPKYIHARLKFDVVEDVGQPAKQPGNHEIWGNAFLFLLELGMICAFTTAAGVYRARHPYNEATGRWLREQALLFPPGFGNALVLALETNRLADWVAAAPPISAIAIPSSGVIVYFDLGLPIDDPDAPVYLSVRETTVPQQGRIIKKGTPNVKTLLNQVRLTPQETAMLVAVFPALKALADMNP